MTTRLIPSDYSLSYARVTFPQCLPELVEHYERWVVRRREEEEVKSDGWDDDKNATLKLTLKGRFGHLGPII